jgi:type III secretion protein L
MPSNIVKNFTNGTKLSRTNLVKNRIFEADTNARRIVAAAEEKAAQIISEAQNDAEKMREDAYRYGKERAAAEFTEIIAAAMQKRETMERELEKELLQLSVKLAEKIIGREINGSKKTIVDIVSNALRNVRQQQQLIIRVNPTDLPQLEDAKSSFTHSGRAEFLYFEPDPKVSAGGCVIESEVGTVDARLETQLKILERALLRQADVDEQ